MPRQKLTAPSASDPSADLPDLTPKQTHFVECILAGKTATEAYRTAYDCADSSNKVIWNHACKVMANGDVRVWLSAARKANLDTGRITLDSHQSELARLREIALDTGNVGAAVQAEISRGKAQGLYIERFEDVTARDPIETIKAIQAVDPALAKMLMQRLAPQLLDLAPERVIDHVGDVAAG